MRRERVPDREAGFTLVELVVAITIIAGVFLALAHATGGAMAALQASRARSAFTELLNAEMEHLRSIRFDALGVDVQDVDLITAYPGSSYDGRPAVQLDVDALQAADPTFPTPPAAVSQMSAAEVGGILVPYTIRRWVTWSDVAGAPGSTLIKRIDVELEWSESGRGQRAVSLHSIRYPGGLGPEDGDPPVAAAVATPTTGAAPLQVDFDASASSDPDGDLVTVAWDFGDGQTATGAITSHWYSIAGVYHAKATVADPGGRVDTKTIVITVSGGSSLFGPNPSISSPSTSGVAPFTVNVSGSATSGVGGDNGSLTYHWSWGDGTLNGSGVNAAHEYAAPGTYTITLTVIDGFGRSGTATQSVTVLPLDCQITAASFRNPSGNGTPNDITIESNGKPASAGFTFSATSNTACTAVSVGLPTTNGSLVVALSYADAGSVRTWSGTSSVDPSLRFNKALDQSGQFTSSGGQTFPITFDVHT